MLFQHVYLDSGKKRAPTVLVFHGMGGNEESLLNFVQSVAPEANILSVRGNVIENGMTRFYKSGFGQWDIMDCINEMTMFLNEANAQYGFERINIHTLGWSNGANMASLLLLYAPSTFKSAMLFRPLLPPSPSRLPDLTGTQILISGGMQDEIDPPKESEELADLLRSANADVSLRWHEGGHSLAEDDKVAARLWWTENTMDITL